jgi:alpha-tubulin suppressor-like RCC1 family protein
MESHSLLAQLQKEITLIVSSKDSKCVKVGQRDPWIDVQSMYLQVACGENHLIALAEDGTLVTFGDCSQGQLGRMAVSRNHRIRRQFGVLICVGFVKNISFQSTWCSR